MASFRSHTRRWQLFSKAMVPALAELPTKRSHTVVGNSLAQRSHTRGCQLFSKGSRQPAPGNPEGYDAMGDELQPQMHNCI